jgi:hypothetical protein
LDGKFGHARWPPPPTTPTDYAEYVEADEDPECVKEDEDSKEDENDEFAEEDDEFADDVEDSEPTVEDWEAFRAFKRLEKKRICQTLAVAAYLVTIFLHLVVVVAHLVAAYLVAIVVHLVAIVNHLVATAVIKM